MSQKYTKYAKKAVRSIIRVDKYLCNSARLKPWVAIFSRKTRQHGKENGTNPVKLHKILNRGSAIAPYHVS